MDLIKLYRKHVCAITLVVAFYFPCAVVTSWHCNKCSFVFRRSVTTNVYSSPSKTLHTTPVLKTRLVSGTANWSSSTNCCVRSTPSNANGFTWNQFSAMGPCLGNKLGSLEWTVNSGKTHIADGSLDKIDVFFQNTFLGILLHYRLQVLLGGVVQFISASRPSTDCSIRNAGSDGRGCHSVTAPASSCITRKYQWNIIVKNKLMQISLETLH